MWVQNQEKSLMIIIGTNDYKAASWSYYKNTPAVVT
jgi:hypothetical protein